MNFNILEYKNYGTASVILKECHLRIRDTDPRSASSRGVAVVGKKQKGKYGVDSIPITLTPKQVKKMKGFEGEINNILDDRGYDKVTILYGNKLYAKINKSTSTKHLNTIKVCSVYINGEYKSYPQVWVR